MQQEKGEEEVVVYGKGQENATKGKNLDIEVVAESFGAVAISKTFAHGLNVPKLAEAQKRKWVRKKEVKKQGSEETR